MKSLDSITLLYYTAPFNFMLFLLYSAVWEDLLGVIYTAGTDKDGTVVQGVHTVTGARCELSAQPGSGGAAGWSPFGGTRLSGPAGECLPETGKVLRFFTLQMG